MLLVSKPGFSLTGDGIFATGDAMLESIPYFSTEQTKQIIFQPNKRNNIFLFISVTMTIALSLLSPRCDNSEECSK